MGLKNDNKPPHQNLWCGGKGFLLLEVLVSIIIITTVVVVINRAFSLSLKAVGLAGDYLLSTCVLEDKIFDIQIENSFTDTKVSDTIEMGNKKFIYTLNISDADIKDVIKDEDIDEDKIFLKKATLNVNWQGDDLGIENGSRLKVSTYVWEKKEK